MLLFRYTTEAPAVLTLDFRIREGLAFPGTIQDS
jgi:hypothetical protein